MSSAIKTQGTLFQRQDPTLSPVTTYATIGEVTGFTGPGGEATEIDVTHLGSTAKEFLMGLKDEGTVTLDMNYIVSDTQQQGLQTDRTNQTLRNFRIAVPNSPIDYITFAAYVQGFSISAAPDSKYEGSVTLRVSGAVTWPT
jgi:hypothetical protein